MKRLLKKAGSILVASAMGLGWTGAATAGIHTWDIVEVFSDSTGNIQYIELQDTGTGGAEVNIGNTTVSATAFARSHSVVT